MYVYITVVCLCSLQYDGWVSIYSKGHMALTNDTVQFIVDNMGEGRGYILAARKPQREVLFQVGMDFDW